MANTKEYKIVINGLTESINAVESLNKQLDNLEKRMNAINATKVSTGGGSSRSGGGSSALSEEEAIQREINKLKQQGAQLDAKIAASQDEIYKRVDATKQLLKETVADQKAIAAQERLTADAYSNTMAGMKSKLADIKAVINTTDLGDGDKIKQMTKDADELNTKLLEIEKSYGQYGRNVGNYANGVAEGLQKVKVTIGDTVREFDNAKQASKTLNGELKTMAANGQQDTEAFKQLQQAVMELDSNIADAKKPMDNLMDSMEGVMAVANAGQGLRALFGVDDAEIQKSIQKLVALQNTLKGLETINKQIQTREGVGKWIAPFTTGIDKATKKLLTYNTTLLGTGKASKVAAVGIKAFSTALKLAVSAGILLAVDLLVEGIMELVEAFNKADEAAENTKKVQEEGAKAYAEGAAKIALYKQRVESFNGTKKQEKKLVEEFNKDLGEGLGTYRSISEVQKALIEKSDAYCEALRKEAEAQALLNLYTEAYVNLQRVRMANAAGENDSWWRTRAGNEAHRADVENAAQKDADVYWSAYLAKQKELEQHNKDNKLFDYSDQIDKGSKNTAETVKKAEENIAKTRIDAMKNGFAKTMAELDLERNKRIEEAKKTAYKINEQIALANKIYNQKVLEATIAHHQQLIAEQKSFNDEWEKLNQSSYSRNVETSRLSNSYNFNEKKRNATRPTDDEGKDFINQFTYNYNNIIKYNQKLIESYQSVSEQAKLAEIAIEGIKKGEKNWGDIDDWNKQLDEYTRKLYELTSKYPGIEKAAEDAITTSMYEAYATRYMARGQYYEKVLEYTREYAEKELKIEKDKLDTEQYNLEQAEKKRHELMASSIFDKDKPNDAVGARVKQLYEGYAKIFNSGDLGGMTTNQIGTYFSKYREEMDKWLDDLEEKAKKGEVAWEEYIEITNSKLLKSYIQLRADAGDNLQMLNNGFVSYMDNLRQEFQEHENTMLSIQNSANQKMKGAEEQKNKDIRKANADFYQSMESEFEEALSSINNLIETSQQRNSLGLINMSKTKQNLDDLKDTVSAAFRDIKGMEDALLEKLGSGEIEFEDFEPIYEQLRTLELQFTDTANNIKRKTSEIFTDFMGEIADYAQQLGSALSSMLQAFSEYTDQQHENEINQLEKQIDEIKELYDKQEEIVNEHKDKLNEIEDELANARGSRRQHLIDQLNAEMAAQRAAFAEQKRLEKEEKALEQKKDREEKKRKEDQKKAAVVQATINGATAFMNALAQQPIWLGIAMAAMTAAMTAVQIATIKSQKYAEGGVIQGKSHSQGGVKVLGGQAEVEGGEFITNKYTTSQNTQLLQFVNSKKRKLNIDDFIEFYSNDKTRKNISKMSPTRKFAEGGVIPSLRSDISVDDRLLAAFEAYAERPSVVSVVDINNRQSQVKNVQVLAGLTE